MQNYNKLNEQNREHKRSQTQHSPMNKRFWSTNFWPLCCLSFDLRIQITPLVSSNYSDISTGSY